MTPKCYLKLAGVFALGGLASYLFIRPSVSAAALPSGAPPFPARPRVPVTAADMGKTLQVDFANFKRTSFSLTPGTVPGVIPSLTQGNPTGIGPFRLLGGSIGADGSFSRVDGSFSFPDGSIAFGSVPPEAVLSVGSILPIPAPVSPASFLFGDLKVGDTVIVDTRLANVPGMAADTPMRVDMILSDRSMVSVTTVPLGGVFKGTIPRSAIVSVIPTGVFA